MGTGKKAWPWKRILLWGGGSLGGAVLLILLLGPWIIGSIVGARVEDMLEERFGRKASVGGSSFRWSGRIRVEDVKVDGLLAVKSMKADVGLWGALGGRYRAEVEVRGLRAVVERDVEGRYTFEPGEDGPSRPRETREKAHVQATIDVRDAELVVRGGGRETVFTGLALTAAVDTLEKPVAWTLTGKDPAGGTFEAGGTWDLEKARGRVTAALQGLSMDNLAGLARAAANDGTIDLRGTLTAGVDYAVDGLETSGRSTLRIEPFSARLGTAPIDLESLTFTHEGDVGRHAVTVHAGRMLSLTAESRIEDIRRARKATTELSVDVDFGELSRVLPGLTARGSAGLRGTIRAEGPVDEDLGGQVRIPVEWDLRSRGTATELRWGEREFRLGPFSHSSRGTIDGKGDGRASLEVSSGDAVRLTFDAALKDVFGRPEADVRLAGSSDLKELGPLVADAAGFKPGLAFEGRSTLSGTFQVGPDRLRADLEAAATGVAMTEKEGRRHAFDPLTFSLAAGWDRAAKRAVIEKLALASDLATLDARGSLSTGPLSIEDSRLTLRLDLAKLAPLVDLPPALDGQAKIDARAKGESFDATVTSPPLDATLSGDRRTIRVQATLRPEKVSPRLGGAPLVVPLEATLGADPRVVAKTAVERLTIDGRAYSAKAVEIDWRARSGTTILRGVDLAGAKEDSIRIGHDLDARKLAVESAALKGEATGLRGTFTYVPDRLGAALSPWLSMKGAEERSIAFALEDAADGLRGTIDVDLAPTTHTGFTVSGKVHARLESGRATVAAPLGVNGGTADLRVVLDFRDTSPVSSVDARVKDVQANAAMEPLLAKLSPIFHTLNGSVGGRMTSDLKLEWRGPLESELAKTALRGQASLSVPDLAVVGSPAVQLLLGAMGEEGRLEGELSAPSVRIADGRTHYEAMRLRLKRYELRFKGWVDFDREMKLEVEMPLTESMSKRYPNLQKYVGTTLFVPLEGTASRPRLDLDKALRVYVQRAAEGILEEKLRELLERRRKQ